MPGMSTTGMMRRGLIAAVIAAVLDQASKFLVLGYFNEPGCGGHSASITSFFDLVITCNRGVSFGLFNRNAEFGALVFSLTAALIVVFLLYWLSRVRSTFLAVSIG